MELMLELENRTLKQQLHAEEVKRARLLQLVRECAALLHRWDEEFFTGWHQHTNSECWRCDEGKRVKLLLQRVRAVVE